MSNEELVLEYQNGNKDAMDELLVQNKGIVNKIANRFYIDKLNSIDREDLIQQGYLGLIKAASRYDFNAGTVFITYASYWIYQSIRSFVYNNNTNDEVSLNKTTGDEGTELEAFIEDGERGQEELEDLLFIKELHEELEDLMKHRLTNNELQVLKLHYGWKGKGISIRDIALKEGMSVWKIQNLEEKALRKLKHSRWTREKGKNYLSELE